MADLRDRFKYGKENEFTKQVISYNNERSDTVSFTAYYCLKTSKLKKIPHKIIGTDKLNGKIISVPCSCEAGLGEQCKHIIAIHCYIVIEILVSKFDTRFTSRPINTSFQWIFTQNFVQCNHANISKF
ncbi:hypothetical protein PV325_003677 [Microctonus aethiopoides]|nr:hypothetical protein PV325_003677 [Microctonus aethiopoides]